MARIILADDDEIVADIVISALLAAGHPVGWFANGKEALAMIRRRPPELVILDCEMPGLSGPLVLREMRRSALLFRVPVLMLTVRSGLSDERIARFDGADDYVGKPFDPEFFVVRVEALLAGRRNFI